MGFLRKVGRKVNRALGKVFGQKVGSLIGSIGLSMVMWQGAKMLFPGTTSAISEAVANTKNAVFGTPTEAVLEVSKNLDPNLINNNTTPITGGEVSSAGAGTGAGTGKVVISSELFLISMSDELDLSSSFFSFSSSLPSLTNCN